MRGRIGTLVISLVLLYACPGLALGAGCFPVIVGNSTIPSNASGVFSDDDHAYVTDENFGLWVFDISDPGAPVQAG